MSVSSAVVLVLALFAAPTAHAGSVSADYARQVDTVQLRLASIEASQVEMEATLRRLEELQRSIASAPSSGSGGASSDEIRALRGDLEVMQFELRTLKESVESLATDVDTRLLWQEMRSAQLEQALGMSPPPMPVDGAPLGPERGPNTTGEQGTGDDPTIPAEEASAESLMELAVEHMQEGRQPAARAVLTRLVSEFPDDASMPEVVYRIAETYFNQEQWLTAVTEFQKVVDRYPRHELAGWAMLRQGEAFDRRGNRSDAVLFWEGVTQRYPGTPAASEARELLQQ